MKVFYDYQILVRQEYGGVSRYHFNIYKKMQEKGIDIIQPVIFPCNKYYQGYLYGKTYPEINKRKLTRYITYFVNEIVSFVYIIAVYATGGTIDIIHPTWYASVYPYLIKRILGKRSPQIVLTVHDMIQELYEVEMPVFNRAIKQKKKMLNLCSHCICVSNNTMIDLLKLYPMMRGKTSVIYHGYDWNGIGNQKKIDELGFAYSYILYVGVRENYYKNFKHICDVMVIIDNNIQCICVGGGEFTCSEIDLMRREGIIDRMRHVSADEKKLQDLYSSAICLVYPSLYEGFGFPIIEAFANDCPVLVTDYSCFPEIAGDAALYIDGYDASKTAYEIQRVKNDKVLRKRIIELGKERLKMFSWDIACQKTIEVYRLVSKACNNKNQIHVEK